MKTLLNIKVAIIGCGKIAEKHAKILTSNKLKKLNLVAVCDIDKNKAKRFGKKYEIHYFDDIDKLLNSVNIDLVVICTSSGLHYKNALKISKYKKDIIIEKPICLDLDEAKKIIKIFKKNKNMLFVVMQYRLNPYIIFLKKIIQKKLLGKITSISIKVWWCRDQKYYDEAKWRGTWKLDGGVFMKQGIHHIDMISWLLGPIKSVTAIIKRRLVKIETEDTGSAILDFKNGVLGTIEVSTSIRPKNLENSITILGEKGNIKVGGLQMNKIEIYDFINKKKAKNFLSKNMIKDNNNHYLFYKNILNNLMIKKNYKSDDGAVKSLEIVNAIYQSITKKRRIYLPIKSKIINHKTKLMSELKN